MNTPPTPLSLSLASAGGKKIDVGVFSDAVKLYFFVTFSIFCVNLTAGARSDSSVNRRSIKKKKLLSL